MREAKQDDEVDAIWLEMNGGKEEPEPKPKKREEKAKEKHNEKV